MCHADWGTAHSAYWSTSLLLVFRVKRERERDRYISLTFGRDFVIQCPLNDGC